MIKKRMMAIVHNIKAQATFVKAVTLSKNWVKPIIQPQQKIENKVTATGIDGK